LALVGGYHPELRRDVRDPAKKAGGGFTGNWAVVEQRLERAAMLRGQCRHVPVTHAGGAGAAIVAVQLTAGYDTGAAI